MSEIINAFISCLLFMVTLYIYGKMIFEENKNISTIKKIIIFAIICIIHTIIFIYIGGTYKTILLCTLYVITLKSLFKATIPRAVIATIIYAIMSMLFDLLTLTIATSIIDINKEVFHQYYAGGILGNIAVSTILLIFTYIIRKPYKKAINYNLSTSIKIIIVSIMTLISLAIFFYNLINKFRLNNNIFGYIIVIITLVVILFYLFKQKIDNDLILKKYDDLLNVMKTYESDIEEQRTMIHETRNELMTIKSKINDKEKETAIIKYIDSILGDKVSSKMSKYSKFKYLPSNGIKGFFYYKFMEAEKRGIKVSVNISKKIENSYLGNLNTKDFKDLVRIIGVYLDNAIDASSESKDKKLGIEVYIIKEDIEIIISNTFENKIDEEKLGIEIFTTKGKNHGHGLLLVKHILKGNSIFEAHNEILNSLYIQKLKIKR